MRAINVIFDDEDFERLNLAKGDLSWHDFLLKLAAPAKAKSQ